jgi:hypothetical protein
MIQTGFFVPESLPRLVDGVGIEACLTAADSGHGRLPGSWCRGLGVEFLPETSGSLNTDWRFGFADPNPSWLGTRSNGRYG